MVRKCRAANLSVTTQRIAVFEAIVRSDRHPSCEDVYREVRRRHPSLSVATVYKTVEVLIHLGVVREVPVATGSRRFDANLDKHHHLVCTKCKRIADVYDDNLDAIAPPAFSSFLPAEATVVITGTCIRCPRSRPKG